MPKSAQEIAQLYHARRVSQSSVIARQELVRTAYNGEMHVAMPELDEAEQSAVVNLLMQGVDQFGMRIASTMPDVYFPPLRSGIDVSENRARSRRKATLGWWGMNNMQLILRQRARYWVAYANAPVTLSPISSKVTDKRQMPFWRPRNPMHSFLPMPDTIGDMEPENAIFLAAQTRSWLEDRYPTAMMGLEVAESQPDTLFEVLEYIDATEIVKVVVGKEAAESGTQRDPYGNLVTARVGSPAEVLDRAPNRAGIPLVVSPGRIVLDRMVGMFDQLPGLMHKQAKLDSLEYVSIKRSIFSTQYMVTHPTSPSNAVMEQEATGIKGQVGEIRGGQIQTVHPQPSPQVTQAIDRLERNERVTAGIPSQMGGENPTNVRTARASQSIVSQTITMTIAEAQDSFAASLEAEDVRGIALMKGWHKGKTFGYTQPRSGKAPVVGQETYSVTEDFETDMHTVQYSMPGTDAAAIPIELGQRAGTGELSMYSIRVLDPIVDTPILEGQRVTQEGLNKAMLTGLEQQAASGALDPLVIAQIDAKLMDSSFPSLASAYAAVHKEMQKQQATQSPQPTAQATQQPGISPPGAAGAPNPGGAIPPASPTQSNLSSILQTLRRPSNQGAPEKALS